MKIQAWTFAAVALAGLALTIPSRGQDTATLFNTKCAVCHGTDGKAASPMAKSLGVRDFAAPAVKKESDAELEAITKNGKNKMPAYKGTLSDAQIEALTAYVRKLAGR